MKGFCATCGRPLKDTVAIIPGAKGVGPQRVKVCKSPICERYMQPQEDEQQ